MKDIYPAKIKGIIYLSLLMVLLTSGASFAQLIYQPYSYQFYQKLNKDVYSPQTSLHTALKPYFISDSSSLRHSYDSLMQNNIDNSKKSWLNHLLFSGHLVEVKNKEFTFYIDYLTDFGAGKEFNDGRSTNINTRGYEISGTIGSKFFFYTSGYENQGKFANYYENYIANTGILPSQAPDRTTNYSGVAGGHDWSYSTAMLGFNPNKNISIALGQDKIFIGDGYRSVLLSDFSPNYPLLRFTANIGKHVQYMATWTYMNNQSAQRYDINPSGPNNRRTWGAFHFIDWSINNRASLGFFNALIAAEADDYGNRHGFDINYVNPIFFASSLAPSGPIPDHTLFGFNGKYKILDKTTLYGQALFDQSGSSSNTSARNAFQIGLRGADLFKVNSFNYLFEFNTAAPYTYANQNPVVNYAQLNEPLAHPLGANFKELLGILNYSVGKFDIQGQINYAKYGLNSNLNYGKDIRVGDNVGIPVTVTGNGQGIATTLKYAEGSVAYVLNPKYNLRFEIGAVLRQETNAISDTKTALVTFGLRTSFRNLYHDF